MDSEPSIYYLWLREHPEESCVTLAPPLTPYFPYAASEPADEDDLTAAG